MILNTRYTKKEFEKLLTEKLFNEFAIDIASATDEQIYRALALIARGMLSEKRKRFIARTYGANGKQVYYLCMEFLMGRSLKTSLLNLGLCGVADEVLRDYSMKLDNIYEQEPDAGLGNGGLGRLAACYLDGMATDDIPGTGYSILYEYGIFKQKIVDGWQQERADNWLPGGGVWLKSHPDQAVEVRFDGEIEESWDGVYHHVEHKNYSSVIAVPSDMYVAGYDSNGVSQLRLWQAKAPGFDMDSFNADVVPKTYIFGAKAAPGYYMAKQMIRLICKLGALIDADPMVREKLRVVYLEDYNVTTSERLMPASEVSEQISLAGTEASGTGNMKFMLNGAVTLGTLDGANVEIAEAAGRENEIIFGMLTPEVNDLKRFGYHPSGFINNCPEAAEVLAFLERGWGGESFHEIVNNLRTSDPYMVMADFADYRRAQNDLSGLYRDRGVWNRMSLMNIANAGIFSADRAVNDYARDIWHVKPIK